MKQTPSGVRLNQNHITICTLDVYYGEGLFVGGGKSMSRSASVVL